MKEKDEKVVGVVEKIKKQGLKFRENISSK